MDKDLLHEKIIYLENKIIELENNLKKYKNHYNIIKEKIDNFRQNNYNYNNSVIFFEEIKYMQIDFLSNDKIKLYCEHMCNETDFNNINDINNKLMYLYSLCE